jgi:hypothetical protein
VEPMGFEPTPSAVQRRQDSLPQISRGCKIPAHGDFLLRTHCSSFQEIYSGCCTVAAQSYLFRLLIPIELEPRKLSSRLITPLEVCVVRLREAPPLPHQCAQELPLIKPTVRTYRKRRLWSSRALCSGGEPTSRPALQVLLSAYTNPLSTRSRAFWGSSAPRAACALLLAAFISRCALSAASLLALIPK